MFEFHNNRLKYFEIQEANATAYIIPFIQQHFNITKGMRVLEIGCGEAGVLKAFINIGCQAVGIEFDAVRIIAAEQYMPELVANGSLSLITKNIYDVSPQELNGAFDIIILKDVIEHIHNQPKLMATLHNFLNHSGIIFYGFPPWQMPFGGHQQICKNKWLSRLPYYHLLPKKIYIWLLKSKNENLEEMLEIRETGLSIETFERYNKQTNYKIVSKIFYFINPIYKYKFNLKVRQVIAPFKYIPWLRNFYTTCMYYIVTKRN
jgi:SAM-dependent methyltransferase